MNGLNFKCSINFNRRTNLNHRKCVKDRWYPAVLIVFLESIPFRFLFMGFKISPKSFLYWDGFVVPYLLTTETFRVWLQTHNMELVLLSYILVKVNNLFCEYLQHMMWASNLVELCYHSWFDRAYTLWQCVQVAQDKFQILLKLSNKSKLRKPIFFKLLFWQNQVNAYRW